jgi:hypothetical protein
MGGLVETMMTADGFQLTAYGLGRMRGQKNAGAVSRKPMVGHDLPEATTRCVWARSLSENLCGPQRDGGLIV